MSTPRSAVTVLPGSHLGSFLPLLTNRVAGSVAAGVHQAFAGMRGKLGVMHRF